MKLLRSILAFAGSVLAVIASIASIALVVSMSASIAACHRDATAASEDAVNPPEVTDATTGMLFTWIDDKGEFHVEEHATGVPESARSLVRVADPAHEAPPQKIFLADFTTPGPGGKYPVHVAPRADFEKVAVERRQKNGAVLVDRPPEDEAQNDPSAGGANAAPSGAGSAPGPADTSRSVIVYGASWCGPCHQAQNYLKQHGVAFVYKDIDQDPAAAREMQGKLSKAGMRSGSIPVLDVRGKILVGFEPGALGRALGQPI